MRELSSCLGRSQSEDRGYLLKIGSMIERPVFYEHLNAIEILEMHLRYMGKEASVSGMLDRVGLYHARKKPVSSYSLGMKQRLGFARALIHRPELLVLDEPLNGMDPVVAAEMIQMLKEAAQNGAAILLSSHMLGEMRKTADRIGVLTGGCIRREITEKEEIRDHPQEMEEELVTLMRGGVTNEKTV